MSENIYLSPSKSSTFDDCPRKFYLQYIAKVREKIGSPNLVFGTVFDEVWNAFLLQQVHANIAVDLPALFKQKWDRATTRSIKWAQTKSKQELESIGLKMVALIPGAWEESRFSLLLDKDGIPLVQRSIVLNLGNGLFHRLKLDLAVVTRTGNIAVIDNKTAGRDSGEFLDIGEQVVDYQIAVDAIGVENDWEAVSEIGYWEAMKLKEPKINKPHLRPAATAEQIQERLAKLHYQAKLIRMGEFYKNTRMAYNSPCVLGCGFMGLCHRSSEDDVLIPNMSLLRNIGINLIS